MKFSGLEGLSFDDVILLPGFSKVLPADVDIRTLFSRNVRLVNPLASAAMDTVTEKELAIALAREGGIGIIHRNMNPERQAAEVAEVKRAQNWIIGNPYTLRPDQLLSEAKRLMVERNISGIPIVDAERVLCGILTSRDLVYLTDADLRRPISEEMTAEGLVTAPFDGMTIATAKEKLREARREKLLLVGSNGELAGLITHRDIRRREECPDACLDINGCLRVGAAIGVGQEAIERTELLIKAGADVIVIDTAQGYSESVIKTAKEVVSLAHKSGVDVVVGNVATREGATALVVLGIDGIRVGASPGTTCITALVSGCGRAQLRAIMEVAAAIQGKIPVIADGGIRYPSDIVKALAAGADSVMSGGLFAGTDESPGDFVFLEGDPRPHKRLRGMGSLPAMEAGSSDRYSLKGVPKDKLVPQGVEGLVLSIGPLSRLVNYLVGGLRSGCGLVGAKNIKELQDKAVFEKITSASVGESRPHNIFVGEQAFGMPSMRREGR